MTINSYLDIDQEFEEAYVIFTENDECIFGINEAQLEQAHSAEESKSLEDTNDNVSTSVEEQIIQNLEFIPSKSREITSKETKNILILNQIKKPTQTQNELDYPWGCLREFTVYNDNI
ncbi:unnamed protein product [Brachionus calyciflorus]|uniref:Uncharacterized protein n=1 Tax=Brachionus calyciflorus TaxID=104777 RepID=A0A814BCC1_9BILA|nr:unnamed protein product [Brachionus calyciflorus]